LESNANPRNNVAVLQQAYGRFVEVGKIDTEDIQDDLKSIDVLLRPCDIVARIDRCGF